MVDNILSDYFNASLVHQRLFTVNVPHIIIVNVFLLLHRADIFHTEGKHILVSDGINNGIGVQLVAKRLCGGLQVGMGIAAGVLWEDGCAGEAKDVIFLELLDYCLVHIAKLRAVALIKDEHDVLLIGLKLGILLDKCGEFLNCGYYDTALGVLQLATQNSGVGVTVGSTFLKAVILFHRLVVKVFAVNDEKNLVNKLQLGCHLCRLE